MDRQDSCTQGSGLVGLELPVSGYVDLGLSSVGAGPQPLCCCVARGGVVEGSAPSKSAPPSSLPEHLSFCFVFYLGGLWLVNVFETGL